MRKAVTLITLHTNDNHTPSRRINKNPIFKGCIIPSRLPERLTNLQTILVISLSFMRSVRNADLCLRFAITLKTSDGLYKSCLRPRGFGFSRFVARKSVLECSIGFVSRTMGIILASREGMGESMPKTRYHSSYIGCLLCADHAFCTQIVRILEAHLKPRVES